MTLPALVERLWTWRGRKPADTETFSHRGETKKQAPSLAFVTLSGIFHCSCRAAHNKGPNGLDVYQCPACGKAWRLTGGFR